MSWPTPSEQAFIDMGHHECGRLIDWIESGELSIGLLTRAAEALGRSALGKDCEQRAVDVLCTLMEHPAPLVREGAVLGADIMLCHSETLSETLMAKVTALCADPSNGVKLTAQDTLESVKDYR